MGLLLYAKYCTKCYLRFIVSKTLAGGYCYHPCLRRHQQGTERLKKVPGVIQNVCELEFLAGRWAPGLRAGIASGILIIPADNWPSTYTPRPGFSLSVGNGDPSHHAVDTDTHGCLQDHILP